MMYRELRPTEEREFRQWARDNFDRGITPSEWWHPVVLDEWAAIERERATGKAE